MKKILAATLSIAALSVGAADAADLAVKARPAVVAAPACANFGGGYIGVQGGAVHYENRFQDLDNYGVAVSTVDQISRAKMTDTSWHIGPQAGFNWQSGCAVFGVQADWSWSDARADSFWTDFGGVLAGGFANTSSEMRWFGTARARAGVVVNDLLLYATGGVAFAKFDRNFSYTGNAGAPTPTATAAFDNTRVGFVAGLGTEWAWTSNLSLVSEVLYMGFAKDSQTTTCPASACPAIGFPLGTAFRYEFNDSAWVGRVGLNYRFGGGAPVVARY
jgi:outer membrane immunogenic protein